MRKKAISAIIVFTACFWLPLQSGAEVPDWLRVMARQPAKAYADDVNAVVLLDDSTVTIKENGDIVKQGRRVIRILHSGGREYGQFAMDFDKDSRVNSIRGWSITSKGIEYEAKDISEQGVASFNVYEDTKFKVVRVPGADVGTVVGFEYEKKERPYNFQDFWSFQELLPVEQSRYRLHLGNGWHFRASWINYAESKPSEMKGDLVWQITDVPRIEPEPHQPPLEALAGRMIVTFLSDRSPEKSYRSWSEFGSWYSHLAAGVREPTTAIDQRVKELAPAEKPLIDRIKALAGFAQHDVRYVEIQIGIGGWRPHNAADIFNNKYGDCKDKATVLSTMLARIGVKSYYVLVHTERGVFMSDSPPQAAFNHMILAISLPEASYNKPLPALYEHSSLGRLLIFDPTNEFVPFGQIPAYEQDNYGLLVSDQGGEYIKLPLAAPEANGVRRTTQLKLLPDGSIKVKVEEVYTGFLAMVARMRMQNESTSDQRKAIERLVSNNVSGSQIDSFELVNVNENDKDLIVRYQFTADHYAKMTGGLLLVRPRVLGELAGGWDPNKPRHYAYDFPAPFLDSDEVEIALPEGFKADELPDPASIIFPFGEYHSKTEVAGNVLRYHRTYKVTVTRVPFEQIKELAKLFSRINIDEKAQAVLKRG